MRNKIVAIITIVTITIMLSACNGNNAVAHKDIDQGISIEPNDNPGPGAHKPSARVVTDWGVALRYNSFRFPAQGYSVFMLSNKNPKLPHTYVVGNKKIPWY